MNITEVLKDVRFLTNDEGEKTDVLVPFTLWSKMIKTWEQTVELLEYVEDVAILQNWLDRRAKGQTDMMSLDDFEQELVADGLL
ncbi:MAG: hypothetical protein B6242_08095 [Anaerolineaceae bacterium 4572_78]|nr:MAG: hypothetical protein B6242_08095 [Anaerolineaceae bacterium 4572_78]